MADIGLRIDIDTLRGTKLGVPKLLETLKKFNIKATFYFSVGPDNMGRHLWRLIKPTFLIKMFRSKAANLYGWDILFKGTFFPGPLIWKQTASIIKECYQEGHEIGLHAFDHYSWQVHIEKWNKNKIKEEIKKGMDILTNILGTPPTSSASPGWRCTDDVLEIKESFQFKYNSDCRGQSEFFPIVHNRVISQLQLPTTLPTYDEVIGKNGITNSNYNDYVLSLLKKAEPTIKILTIHAEVEGGICNTMFEDFIQRALQDGHSLLPLIKIAEKKQNTSISSRIIKSKIEGREGWVATQEKI